MKIFLPLLLLQSLLTLAHSLVVIRDDTTLFSNGKNEDLFTVTYNSCYVKLPDESYCIVTGVEHSTCNHHQLGVPNKCNDQLTDCKACLNNFQNIQRAETQRNFGIWCDQKNGYITEYNSSSPILLFTSAFFCALIYADTLPSTFSCYNSTGYTPCIVPGVEDSKCLTSMVGFARGCDANNRFCTACILKFFIYPREELRGSMTDWCNYKRGNLAEYDRTIRTCEVTQ